MSIWRARCRELIAKLTAELPADATLAERKKALWGKGYPAHEGTTWGRKMWGREVRAYLARHGSSCGHRTAEQVNWPDHVHFPFREDAHG